MNKKTFFGILTVCSVFGFVLGIKNVLAIGQITEPIVVKDALRGQEISQQLTLTNSESVPVVFQLKGDGQIKDWVSFYKENNLNNKITEFEVSPAFYNSLVAIFRIPVDTPNGTYEGVIDVLVVPEKNKSDQIASVNMKVSRPVSITVSGEEIVRVEATVNPIGYWVKGGDPAQIRVVYTNSGNVAVKPSVQLKVFDKDNKSVFNAIFPYPEGVDAVKAGERKEMPLIEWQTSGQSEGDYLSEVSIMVNNEAVQTEKVTFRVTGAGVANGLAGISGVGSNNQAIVLVGVGILVLLVILAIVLILKKKKTN